MKDKFGKEIFDGCYLRIKYYSGNDGEEFYDAIYKVVLDPFKGLEARMVKLIAPDWTVRTTMSWKNGNFDSDYENGNFENLAVLNKYVKDVWNSYKEINYSNDIEVVEFNEENL